MKLPVSPRKLLLPLVPAYRLALWLRELGFRARLEPVRRLRNPVVSIGNLSTGGAGKTPLTIALAQALTQRGWRVDVLSRGYGRQSQLPARVDPSGAAADFGDEPLQIARATGLPVYVARRRYQAGLLAEANEPRGDEPAQQPRVHLLDDGFQHQQLARNVNILLLDLENWQDSLLPAGNLRESLPAAHRASVIAVPSGQPELEASLRAWGWQGPIWRVLRTVEAPNVSGPVAAFCGIARPNQFFAGLKAVFASQETVFAGQQAAGLQVVLQRAFPDHFPYAARDLDRLLADARAAGATAVLTTAKDLARMGKLAGLFPPSLPLAAVELRIEIEDEDAAIGWLIGQIAPRSADLPL